jgi:hypothetical protein
MERVRNVFGPQSPDIQAFTVYHELRMKETTLFSGKRGRGSKPGTKAGNQSRDQSWGHRGGPGGRLPASPSSFRACPQVLRAKILFKSL